MLAIVPQRRSVVPVNGVKHNKFTAQDEVREVYTLKKSLKVSLKDKQNYELQTLLLTILNYKFML
jgi:hypothetical protein